MCKAGVTKEQGDGFVTHMEGNSVSPSRHLTHLSLRRATPTKPQRSTKRSRSVALPELTALPARSRRLERLEQRR